MRGAMNKIVAEVLSECGWRRQAFKSVDDNSGIWKTSAQDEMKIFYKC